MSACPALMSLADCETAAMMRAISTVKVCVKESRERVNAATLS